MKMGYASAPQHGAALTLARLAPRLRAVTMPSRPSQTQD